MVIQTITKILKTQLKENNLVKMYVLFIGSSLKIKTKSSSQKLSYENYVIREREIKTTMIPLYTF